MTARFTTPEVARALGLSAFADGPDFSSVSTDTRLLEPGALFVALQGERFDGNEFVEQAGRLGAAGAVVTESFDGEGSGLTLFPVPDTTRALGHLARFHRRRCGSRVVGVTGSSGKTTVKEMLVCALRPQRPVFGTYENLNNQVGLPLSILGAGPEQEVWVLELGTSEPGEIRALTEIAEPDDAVITTVGPAHLEGLGSLAGVLAEKLDLLRGASVDGCAVVGELPAELPLRAREIRADTWVAGLGAECEFRPDRWTAGADASEFTVRGVDYRVPAGGEHHLRDALIAVATATRLGVDPGAAAEGLAAYRPVGHRGALLQVGGLTLVADCYNANPESFAAAIGYCATAFPGRRLAAVAGTMLELGPAEPEAHQQVARAMLDAGFSLVLAIGAFQAAFRSASVPDSATVLYPDSVDEVATHLEAHLEGDEVLLVKASRGVKLERVVDALTGGDR